jgi:subtilisin family serine protease
MRSAPRRRARIALAVAGVLLMAGMVPAATAEPQLQEDETTLAAVALPDKPAEAGTYIVQLAEPPVVAYEGGVKGIKATRPAKGKKVDPRRPEVRAYVDHLAARQDAALKRAGGGTKLYSYAYTFNGFAAELSATAAAEMASVPGVLAVSENELLTLDTSTTPDFLGLTDEGGLWDQLGGASTSAKRGDGPGEDVIIGIIDGGIWPEHPSLSDRDSAGKRVYQQIPGWNGRCVPGEQFRASDCNQKVIGARYYNAGWGGNAGIDAQLPDEFNSPRDLGGHGTHVATTAAGNNGVQATGPASVFGSVSGIAPRARLAVYKTCWETGSGGSCFSVDSVAAIDQAVADGVDVINYSVSGSRTNFRDPVEIAFLFAADAGVFVATSAGNSGPGASTVAHPGPWLTTVAAGTHNRTGVGSVTLGNGENYVGASFATEVTGDLVDAADAALSPATVTDAELCNPGALDPALVADAVVLCKRGAIALVDKSRAVAEAGGAGMVLYNDPAGATNTLALFHSVPAVHVAAADGLAVKAYAAEAAATATINDATVVEDEPAPFTATFSSRGPLQASGDLLKPDLIAPGQDILAGVAPPGNNGRLFDLYSGTSMSSPHVAGLAALLIDAHPEWSPMAVKSALMTTGYDVLDSASEANRIFRQGAGHVDPNKAVEPGLVYDADFDDWLGFLCGTQLPASFCTASGIPVLDPSDYNSPSIAIGALAGSQTVTRNVTHVGDEPATYTGSVTGLSGVSATVEPAGLTLDPGETQSFTVTFSTTGAAALNSYTGGQLTWTDGARDVRIPLVVRPVALGVPAAVSGTGDPITYDVGFGYTGGFSATARGLVEATTTAGSVTQDPDQTFDPGDPTGTVAIPVTVPAGSTYARFALFDEDVAPGADLDLYVYQGSTLVGASTTGTSAEEVSFAFGAPTGGPIALTVYVHGWGVPGGSSPFVLHEWGVPASSDGTMTVDAPATATAGTTGSITLQFTGLQAATRYLGSVAYGGTSSLPSPTVVSVTTP